ncbi:hypothetical protein [Halorubrum ezzemoulense]|uniref:hypothetical protein n=1 Tax=Halorubrum ezzemoulense TaxID=337243 RepID=UPI0023308E99|nr:hypothetical protein [Halorubrum ezzemoulense]MDB2238777.1 hypothetical protein [Halorubrum ezzemoulense]
MNPNETPDDEDQSTSQSTEPNGSRRDGETNPPVSSVSGTPNGQPQYESIEFDRDVLEDEFGTESSPQRSELSLEPTVGTPEDQGIKSIQQQRDRAREYRETAKDTPEKVLRASEEVRNLLTLPISEERLVPELERRLHATHALSLCLDKEPLKFVPTELADNPLNVDGNALADDICTVLTEERDRRGFGSAEYTVGKPQLNKQIEANLVKLLADLGVEMSDVLEDRFDMITRTLRSSDAGLQKQGVRAISALVKGEIELTPEAIDECQRVLASGADEIQPAILNVLARVAEQDSDLVIDTFDDVHDLLVNSPSKRVVQQALNVLRPLSNDHPEVVLDCLSVLNRELDTNSQRRPLALFVLQNLASEYPEQVAKAISQSRIRRLAFERTDPRTIGSALLLIDHIGEYAELQFTQDQKDRLIEYLTSDEKAIFKGAKSVVLSGVGDDPYLLNQLISLTESEETTKQARATETLATIANVYPNDLRSSIGDTRITELISEGNEEVCKHVFAFLHFLVELDEDNIPANIMDSIEYYLVKNEEIPGMFFSLLVNIIEAQPNRVLSSDVPGMLPDLFEKGDVTTRRGSLRMVYELLNSAPEDAENPFEVSKIRDLLSADEETIRDAAAQLFGATVATDQSYREEVFGNVGDYPQIDLILTHAVLVDEDLIDSVISLLSEQVDQSRIIGLRALNRICTHSESSVSLSDLDCLEAIIDCFESDQGVEAVSLLAASVNEDPEQLSQTGITSEFVDRITANPSEDMLANIAKAMNAFAKIEDANLVATEGYDELIDVITDANTDTEGGTSALNSAALDDPNVRRDLQERLTGPDTEQANLSISILGNLIDEQPESALEIDLMTSLSEVITERHGDIGEYAGRLLLYLADEDLSALDDPAVYEPIIDHLTQVPADTREMCLRLLLRIAEENPEELTGSGLDQRLLSLLSEESVSVPGLLLLRELIQSVPTHWMREQYLAKIARTIDHDKVDIRTISARLIATYAKEVPEETLEYVSVGDLVKVALHTRSDEQNLDNLSYAISELVRNDPARVYEEETFDDLVTFLYQCPPGSVKQVSRTVQSLIIENEDAAASTLEYYTQNCADAAVEVESFSTQTGSPESRQDTIDKLLSLLEPENASVQSVVTLSLCHTLRVNDHSIGLLKPAMTDTEGRLQLSLVDAVGYVTESNPEATIGLEGALEGIFISEANEKVRSSCLETLRVLAVNNPNVIHDAGIHQTVLDQLSGDVSEQLRRVALLLVQQIALDYPESFDGFDLTTTLLELVDEIDAEDNQQTETLASIITPVALVDSGALTPIIDDPLGERSPPSLGVLLAHVISVDDSILEQLLSRFSSVPRRGKVVIDLALVKLARESPRTVTRKDIVETLRDQIADLEADVEHDDQESARDQQTAVVAINALCGIGQYDPSQLEGPVVQELIKALSLIETSVAEVAQTLQAVSRHQPGLLADETTVDTLVESAATLNDEAGRNLVATLGNLATSDRNIREYIVTQVLDADGPRREVLVAAIGSGSVKLEAVMARLFDHLSEADCEVTEKVEILTTASRYSAAEDPADPAEESVVTLATRALKSGRQVARESGILLLHAIATEAPELVATEETVQPLIDGQPEEDLALRESAIQILLKVAEESPQLVASLVSKDQLISILDADYGNASDAVGQLLLLILPYSPQTQEFVKESISTCQSEFDDETDLDYGMDDSSDPATEAQSTLATAENDSNPQTEPAQDRLHDSPNKTDNSDQNNGQEALEHDETIVSGIVSLLAEDPEIVNRFSLLLLSDDEQLRESTAKILLRSTTSDPEVVGDALAPETVEQLLDGETFAQETTLKMWRLLSVRTDWGLSTVATADQLLKLLDSSDDQIQRVAGTILQTYAEESQYVRRSVASLIETGTDNQKNESITVLYRLRNSDQISLDLDELGIAETLTRLLENDTNREWDDAGILLAEFAQTHEPTQEWVTEKLTSGEGPVLDHACGIAQNLAQDHPEVAFDLGYHELLLDILAQDDLPANASEVALTSLSSFVSKRPESFVDRETVGIFEDLLNDQSEDIITHALLSLARVSDGSPSQASERIDHAHVASLLTRDDSITHGEQVATPLLAILKMECDQRDASPIEPDQFDALIELLKIDIEVVQKRTAMLIKEIAVRDEEFIRAVNGFESIRELFGRDSVNEPTLGAIFANATEQNHSYADEVIPLVLADDPEVRQHGFGVLKAVTDVFKPDISDVQVLKEILAGFDADSEEVHAYTNAILRRIFGDKPERGLQEELIAALIDRLDADTPVEQKFAIDTLQLLYVEDNAQIAVSVAVRDLVPLLALEDDRAPIRRSARTLLSELMARQEPDEDEIVALFEEESIPTARFGSAVVNAAIQNPSLLSAVTSMFNTDAEEDEVNLVHHGIGILQSVAKREPEPVFELFSLEQIISHVDLDESEDKVHTASLLDSLLQQDPDHYQKLTDLYGANDDPLNLAIEKAVKKAAQSSKQVRDALISDLHEGSSADQLLLSLEVLPEVTILNSNPKLPDIDDVGGQNAPIPLDRNHLDAVIALMTHDEVGVRELAERYLTVLLSTHRNEIDLEFALPVAREIFVSDTNEQHDAAFFIARNYASNNPSKTFDNELVEFLLGNYDQLSEEATWEATSCIKVLTREAPAEAFTRDLVKKSLQLLDDGGKHAINAWSMINKQSIQEDFSIYADPELISDIFEAFESENEAAAAVAYQILIQISSEEPEILTDTHLITRLAGLVDDERRVVRWRSADILGRVASDLPETVLESLGEQITLTLDEVVTEYHQTDPSDRALDSYDIDITATEYPGLAGIVGLLPHCADSVAQSLSLPVYITLVPHESDLVQYRAAKVLNGIAVNDGEELAPYRKDLRQALRGGISDTQVQRLLFEALRETGSGVSIGNVADPSHPINEF